MVMERIHGVLDQRHRRAARAAAPNIQRLAENGVEIFFTQVFRHNFFHADMHPGNIFVQTRRPGEPALRGRGLRHRRHARRRATSTTWPRTSSPSSSATTAASPRCTSTPAGCRRDTRVDELEAAVRTVCEPIFNKPLKDISFGAGAAAAVRDRAALRHAGAAAADPAAEDAAANRGPRPAALPELDLWKTAQPILREWARGPAERPQPRAAAAPAAARPERGAAHAAAGAAAVRAAGVRRQLPPHGSSSRASRSCAREIRASARRRDVTIVGAVTLLGGLVWLAVGRLAAWRAAVAGRWRSCSRAEAAVVRRCVRLRRARYPPAATLTVTSARSRSRAPARSSSPSSSKMAVPA